jgi:palmitoyltransferase ZDHHC1/11
VVEVVVGLVVFTRCFKKKVEIEAQIVERLGEGFSRPPFVVIVVQIKICIFLAVSIS